MHSDSPGAGTTRDALAEMRAIVDETRKAIAASQAVLDRYAERCLEPERTEPEPAGEALDILGEISEGLIHAYRFAKHDGDGPTMTLIEKALFHVGRRIARGMSTADAGVVCH